MQTQASTQTRRSLSRDDRGVTLVEYGLALALVLALGTIGLTTLGIAVSDKMYEAEDELN